MKTKGNTKALKSKGKSKSKPKSLTHSSKSSVRKGKSKALKPVRTLCGVIDRKTKGFADLISGSAKRFECTVKRFDRNMNRIGNAFESLYETQSKAGL